MPPRPRIRQSARSSRSSIPVCPSGANATANFPKPTLPDGLDAARQTAIIKDLIKDDYSYAEFTRKSVVAPQLLKLRDVAPSDPKAPARGVDVWFIAYGDIKALDDEKFLEKLINAGKGEGKGKALTKEELAKRKIKLGDEKQETIGHIEFDFLEKVHLKATGRAVWSKTDDSVLVAGEIDPRFLNDPEYPNQWQSIIKEGGMSKLGPPVRGAARRSTSRSRSSPNRPARCSSSSTSSSPSRPAGLNGANLLRSKLPIAVQMNVRSMRARMGQTSGK